MEGAGDAWLDPNITDPAQAMTVALEKGIIEVGHHLVSNRINIANSDDDGLIRRVNE